MEAGWPTWTTDLLGTSPITTAKKSAPKNLWMVYSCASAEPSSASDWTLSQLFSMWYMHSMLCPCVCMCVRVLTFLYRMCLPLLAWCWARARPVSGWLVVRVMSWRAQCQNEKATVLPCLWVSSACVRYSYVFPQIDFTGVWNIVWLAGDWIFSLQVFSDKGMFWVWLPRDILLFLLYPPLFLTKPTDQMQSLLGIFISLFHSSNVKGVTPRFPQLFTFWFEYCGPTMLKDCSCSLLLDRQPCVCLMSIHPRLLNCED